MKKFSYNFLLVFILINNISVAQYPCSLPAPVIDSTVPGRNEGFTDIEISIYNQTWYYGGEEKADSIKVRIIPVGAFYNGNLKYSPIAKISIDPPGIITMISGKEFILPSQTSATSVSKKSGTWDNSNGSNLSIFSYGFGKYKFEFYRNVEDTIHGGYFWEFVNYVYIDYRDANVYSGLPSIYQSMYDLRLDYFSNDVITFKFANHYTSDSNYINKYWHINTVDKNIEVWKFFGTCIPELNPGKGFFSSDSTDNGVYLKWPITANKYNGNIGHENPGDLGMNLVINHNITTLDTALGNGNITIAKNGYLKIADGKIFNMKTPLAGYHNLIVQDSSLLWLDANSHLFVEAGNKLTLKSKGTIKLGFNSEIRFKPGSLFCNEGGRITAHEVSSFAGWGKIVMEPGYHQVNCAEISDFAFSDSVKLILEDSTTLEIPDNTTLHFTGYQCGLIMNPNSKLKMGEGSKILFDSGALIIANGAAFTSLDSTSKWEGIVLSNTDADTITNCTFSNAITTLTITNDANSAYKNRIISNQYFQYSERRNS